MKKYYETVPKILWNSNEKNLWNSAEKAVKQQWENSMKQHQKCCETAMKKYYKQRQ